jgi:CRISPR/Cas system-associated protein endoribonuclease Cas2
MTGIQSDVVLLDAQGDRIEWSQFKPINIKNGFTMTELKYYMRFVRSVNSKICANEGS